MDEQAADDACDPAQPGGAFWAVIPAGGAGTRLWPLSRAARPKFLLPLLGERSLLQETFDRVAALTDPAHTLVVCGPEHAALVARQLPALPPANLIVEPAPRGTAPALALAAALIARADPAAVMGSFAADHDVADHAAFVAAAQTAIAAARTGELVTIGLSPTRPETGFGYIERTDEPLVTTATGVAYRSARFVEKPDLRQAQEYLASGRFLWNASMFFWQPATMLTELARLQPAIHSGVSRIAAAWDTPHQAAVTAAEWANLPDVTIDHGLMEQATRVAVVPAAMGWSDVGDWHGLGELLSHDAHGNSLHGDPLCLDTTDSVIWSDTGRIVAVVGIENIVVVDTPDALLVIDRAKAQQVRRIVAALDEGGR